MPTTEQNMAVERYARGRETSLIDAYIANGPSELKRQLGVNESEWIAIFDYLVFEHAMLFKAIIQNAEFFVELYVKEGITHLREVFEVMDEKYDVVWKVVFDYLAICHEGLKFHLMEHRERYLAAFRERGGDFVRKVLGIWGAKYEEHWKMVLDFLLHATCDDIFTENTYDHGLRAFSQIMNQSRVHRPLNKFGLL